MLELLFNNNLVENVYRAGIGAEIGYKKMNFYIDTLAHKNPALRILEISTRTRGASLPIIKMLTSQGHVGVSKSTTPRFSHFDFTNILVGFFEKAKDLFSFASNRIAFRVLDTKRDVVEQSFNLGLYDLVVTSNVIHTTRDLKVTLTNARKLLKPGRKLILFEITNPEAVRLGFLFGIFPG